MLSFIWIFHALCALVVVASFYYNQFRLNFCCEATSDKICMTQFTAVKLLCLILYCVCRGVSGLLLFYWILKRFIGGAVGGLVSFTCVTEVLSVIVG